jgi:hypothetical protein
MNKLEKERDDVMHQKISSSKNIKAKAKGGNKKA